MDSKVLSSGRLMDKIITSLDKKKPLSVISVGATHSYVLAQYRILTEEQFMNHNEAIRTNSGTVVRGFTFPNIQLRDEMVDAIKKSDIVGFNLALRDKIKSGKMTLIVFKEYGICPPYTFDSLIRRVIMFSQERKFKTMLQNRRIVLIGKNAKEARDALREKWGRKLGFDIVESLVMTSYEQMSEIKKKLDTTQYDLCLLSAGVNSVILAPYIATEHGKVAFDIGQGMTSLITGEVVVTGMIEYVGLKNLLKL